MANYTIEDIFLQDGRGVRYHAIDEESGEAVILRRFFPSGAKDGQLDEDGIARYLSLLEWMKGLRHPSLREVRDGGVDVIDRVPWVVSPESRDMTLATAAELPESDGRALVQQAMDLFAYLGEDGAKVVDLSPSRIRYRDPDGTTPGIFYFAVEPDQLLTARVDADPIRELGRLVEWSAGWQGKAQVSAGTETLRGWVARAGRGHWSLDEAHEAAQKLSSENVQLRAPAESHAPDLGNYLGGREQTEPLPKVERGMPWLGWVAAAGVIGAGFFLYQETKLADADKPEAIVLPTREVIAVPSTGDLPVETRLGDERPTARLSDDQVRELFHDHSILGRLSPEVIELHGEVDLTSSENYWTILTGVVSRVRSSKSGKTLYIEFDVRSPEGAKGPCGHIFVPKLADPAELNLEYLEALVGYRLAILGKVTFDRPARRHVIRIKDRRALRSY